MDTPPLIHPGHTLTIYPPLSVVNLLPYDVQLQLSGRERGRMVRKGEKLSHYDVSRWDHLLWTRPHTLLCGAHVCWAGLAVLYLEVSSSGSKVKVQEK